MSIYLTSCSTKPLMKLNAMVKRAQTTPVILAGIGIILVVGSALARFTSYLSPRPGNLIATQPELVWSGLDGAKTEMGEADARFVVVNSGGLPVRVISVQSSCGCTTARVTPEIIAAGSTGVVEVRGTPYPVGERAVTVNLTTDSASTPVVHLLFRMLGTRRSRFLLQAGADLAYVGESFKDDVRQIVAIAIVPFSSKSEPPIIKTDLPFLKIGPPTV